ncbi:hypothetical protein QCA50_004769 [Cerrena zonata]|uniref:NADH:flavin oxidoreductase/NADH oxidase N-terminal domain-containing protein n=1 Tax=Cerrena zonata TaxID=2478898 RepID=A0AAW0GDC2_9APHY
MSDSKVFQPIRIGDINLRHRIVLAPLTRLRADASHVPTEIVTKYYEQRASTKGTLLISEGTIISAAAGGLPHAPHVDTEEQLNGWKKVTEAVHKNESYIFSQIAALGRFANPQILQAEGNYDVVSASDVPIEGGVKPRPLTIDEIKEYVISFAAASRKAIYEAGFDGVELHACHGSLLDQFLQDVSNKRTDEYGGSIENRARFVLEVVDACAKAIGPSKLAVRLSPWNEANGMGMKDPIPTFTYLVTRLAELHPDLAYLHVVEPRITPDGQTKEVKPGQSNDFLRKIWAPRPLMSAGGYTLESAGEIISANPNELIAFGRHFIANPDLPKRLYAGVELNPYNRATFYDVGAAKGYIDYPFYEGSETKDILL